MMSRWRFWSGVTSCVLGVAGYIFLVALCVSGVIPVNFDMDITALMEELAKGTNEVYTLIGYSGELAELLVIAGIVGIVTHKKNWYCNIPVALISGHAAVAGFLGYRYLYPVAAWAAVSLFMSIVAMRRGYRMAHAPQPQAEIPVQEPRAPEQPKWTDIQKWSDMQQPISAARVIPSEPVKPTEPVKPSEPAAPKTPSEPDISAPPRATPVDDYE